MGLKLDVSYSDEAMEQIEDAWGRLYESGYEPYYETGVLVFMQSDPEVLREYLEDMPPEKVYLRVGGKRASDASTGLEHAEKHEVHPEEATWRYEEELLEEIEQDYEALEQDGFTMTFSGGGSPVGGQFLRELLGDAYREEMDAELLDDALEGLDEMEFPLYMQVHHEEMGPSATVTYRDRFDVDVSVRERAGSETDPDAVELWEERIRDNLTQHGTE
jgi:hypothetical protein